MSVEEYTYVAALHGNEVTPLFALQALNVPVLCGNPAAAQAGKRFIERDLNASFGAPSGDTLEERRAIELLERIPPHAPVVDLHTYSCTSPPFVVVVDRDQLELAKRTGIPRIVLMTHNIKSGRALINHRKGVSPEVGMHGSSEAWNTTQEVYRALHLPLTSKPCELYEAVGVIEAPGKYENFTPHPEGFVPVLAGEKAYTHGGLMTRRLDRCP